MPIKDLKERQEYQTKYHKDIWYPKNKKRRIELIRQTRIRNLTKIQSYKTSIGCIDCGYNKHPEALDFDHKGEEKKEFNISTAINRGIGLDRIFLEIKKCDVVCANCHRLRTVKRKALLAK